MNTAFRIHLSFSRRHIQFIMRALMMGVLMMGCDAESPRSTGSQSATATEVTLLNVSYDPTRELWNDINTAFVKHYEKTHNTKLTIKQSHGSSGSQARAIIDGLEADVATLSIWSDTNSLQERGLLKADWEQTFPNRSLPYTSTVVFVTRKGNPKKILDWNDLLKDDIQIVTPSPRTSGNGKLSFLAAWGSVLENGGTEAEALEFVKQLYRRVPVLDAGARGATTTFAQKGVGDVHLALENEAMLEVRESKGELELVYPSVSIVHEPHVAVVDSVVDARGTRAVALEYLQFLYTREGQEIIARNFFRPTDPAVLLENSSRFRSIKCFEVSTYAKNWSEANTRFFADGGIFDQIYEKSVHQ